MWVCSEKAKISAATNRITMPCSLIPSFIDLSSLANEFYRIIRESDKPRNLVQPADCFFRPY